MVLFRFLTNNRRLILLWKMDNKPELVTYKFIALFFEMLIISMGNCLNSFFVQKGKPLNTVISVKIITSNAGENINGSVIISDYLSNGKFNL